MFRIPFVLGALALTPQPDVPPKGGALPLSSEWAAPKTPAAQQGFWAPLAHLFEPDDVPAGKAAPLRDAPRPAAQQGFWASLDGITDPPTPTPDEAPDRQPVKTAQDRLIEQLRDELKKERNTSAQRAAELAELHAKHDALALKCEKLTRASGEVSFDPRPVAITQALLARTVAVAKGGPLPPEMEKKLAAWERRLEPTVRAANEGARAKGTDWLTALKTLDGSGKTADLLSFREAAELVKELNGFTLELYSFARTK